jgi:serine/threonine protein kinase
MKFKEFFKKKKDDTPRTEIKKRFELIGRVGQGSMSKVWRANDSLTNNMVAVKVLDFEKMKRFESRFIGLNKPSEGEISVTMDHPNCVRTFEFGTTSEDEQFLVMEFVEGMGLGMLVDLQDDRMRRYRLSYMIQIGDGLDYLHRAGWIHRDICPRNILLSTENQIKLIDFGLVVPNTAPFRKPGNRTGTANYMAPELIKRQPTDERIDIYSYAITCFEMYTKRHPWDAALTLDAVIQHINKPPADIREFVPKIDEQIANAIMKGLQAQPADRWQSIAEMTHEFREAEARLVAAARRKLAAKKEGGKTRRKKKPVKKRPGDTSKIGVKKKPPTE